MKLILGIFLSGFVAMAAALYSPSDDVVELTASNFQREVVQSDDLWLVEFYAPWCGHCKSLAPEWKKAASALKGIVKVGAVDMDVHQAVGGPYGIRGFPTIKVFGLSKSSPSDYQGQRTAQAIVDGAMTQLKQVVNARLSGGGRKSGGGGGGSRSGGGDQPGNEADVIQLTDGNFDEQVMKGNDLWLVEFFAPWCGHCKRLAPEWAKAATALKGKVKVAAVDSTVHTIISQRFGIQGYPTIKVFQGGEASEYEGGRTAADIISWASTKAAENLPPPEIIQATEQKVLTDACSEHQLCIVSILPHILDCQSECRNKYLQILKKLGDKYKKKMWGWVWAEGGAQPELEDSLGIGGFGYPAMAAVNSRKMKYAMLKGPFSDTGINEFLRELAVGRGSTAPVKNAKLPTITKSDPWDGKDGQLPVEDDIDLSDVDLDDMDSPKKTEL